MGGEAEVREADEPCGVGLLQPVSAEVVDGVGDEAVEVEEHIVEVEPLNAVFHPDYFLRVQLRMIWA